VVPLLQTEDLALSSTLDGFVRFPQAELLIRLTSSAGFAFTRIYSRVPSGIVQQVYSHHYGIIKETPEIEDQ
jgi:hypothetical protein